VTDTTGDAYRNSDRLGAQVVAGGTWSLIGQLVSLGAGFVLTPFVIRILGPTAFGVLTFTALAASCIVFTDLGMGIASTRLGSRAYAANDSAGEAAVIWTALGVVVLAAGFSAAILAAWADPIALRFVGKPSGLRAAAATGLRFACFAFVFRSLAGIANTPQLARLRFGSFTAIHHGAAVMQAVLVLVAVSLGGGVVLATAVTAAVAWLALLVHWGVAVRLQPALRRLRVVRALVPELMRVGLPSALSSLVGNLLFFGDRILVAATRTPQELAFYSVAATMAQLVEVAPLALAQPLVPTFARLQMTSDTDRSALLQDTAIKGLLVFVSPLPLAFYFAGADILRIWAGPEFMVAGLGPAVILSLGACANALAVVPRSRLQAEGRTDIVASIHVALLAPYLLLAGVMLTTWGLTGAAAAWSLRAFAELVVVAAKAGMTPRERWSRAGWVFCSRLLSLTLAMGGALLIAQIAAPRLASALVPVLLLTHSGLAWRLVLQPKDREFLGHVAGYAVRLGRARR
jgi:O-antigen/teichoic acid export membrane protein